MGRLAEMQRKLLEVRTALRFPVRHTLTVPQQMMGPEAMGVANANLVWSDEKVCRNFLCGTCPHTLFTNTVSNRVVPPAGERHLTAFVENGSWCMPEVTYRTPQDRVPTGTGGRPEQPYICTIPDGIRVEHIRICGRV